MNNQELIMKYRELDRDLAEFNGAINGYRRRGKKTFIPTQANVEQAWEEWKQLKARVEELEVPDGVFAVVKNHFADFIDSLDYALQDVASHPEGYFLGFLWGFEDVSRKARGTEQEKSETVIRRLEAVAEHRDAYVELIKTKYDENGLAAVANVLRREALSVENESKRIDFYFPKFNEEQASAVKAAMDKHIEMLRTTADEISTAEAAPAAKLVEDDWSKTVKGDVEEYRTMLKKKLGVNLDELLEWHRSEIEKTRSEVFEIASKLDIPEKPKTMQEINDVLYKYEGPCDSPEEMFRRADEYLKRTRALAHEFVNLPDDEICLCKPISEGCKDSYPWGGYEGGDFSIRPFRGQMFLNQYNYQNVTDGWIKLNSLHEAYPGHHVQYLKTALSETPETVKIGAKYIPILEGTCLRTERAFEWIFGEDPFFPLFVAYRRHHGAVRILVDLTLYYFGGTIEDVVNIYQEELGFERGTARKQVQAHQNMPGYFNCYYYGMKKLTSWEKEFGFNKKDYTELLFSAGYLSMDSFEMLVKLSAEDRERYLHDFCSLLKEDFKYEA
ncbi:MAG: DUF885 family protein [Oscillospiraceae bacterium]|nr:DUF885 family protein [Oscillospiraceae bacterium]MBR5305911.1 DUF885 family protein [Oscillospiraceae bacterium]